MESRPDLAVGAQDGVYVLLNAGGGNFGDIRRPAGYAGCRPDQHPPLPYELLENLWYEMIITIDGVTANLAFIDLQ